MPWCAPMDFADAKDCAIQEQAEEETSRTYEEIGANRYAKTSDISRYCKKSELKTVLHEKPGSIEDGELQRLRSLANYFPIGMALIDSDGIIYYFNPRFKELFGYNLKEISCRKDWLRRAHPDAAYRKEVISLWIGDSKISAPGDKSSRVLSVNCKDGSEKIIKFTIVKLDDGGDLLTCEDITESKRHEDKLKTIGYRLSAIIDFLPDATFVVDSSKRVIAWNRALEDMTGVSKENILGKGDYAYGIPFYGEARPMLLDLIEGPGDDVESKYLQIQRNGRSICGEAYVPSLFDGRGAYVWATASSLHDDTGKLIASIESIRDISDRKRAEEAVRESEQRFRAIFDTAEDTIFIKDRNLHYVQANRAMERLFGLPSSEIIGMTDKELFGSEAAAIINRADLCVLQGQTHREEHTIPVNGRPKTFHTVKVPMKSHSGEIVGICGIARDISEIKRVEDVLKAAKKAADEGTRAKSEFLANMSHEIRTPMNAVIGTAELLLGTEMTPDQKEYAEIIRSSGETLLAIINDILDLSKIEGGKMELESRPFDLRLCVERSIKLVAASAAEKGLELICIIKEDVPRIIIGDPTRLRQVIINLVNNAVKFTEKGNVKLVVAGRRVNGPLSEILFEVKDTGIGIPENKMGRLFRPFSQVDASTTRKFGGSGLGLAICKRLVEIMGGSLRIESREGIGSTFSFSILARAADKESCDDAQVSPKTICHAGANENHDLRILLAEDNAVNQRVMIKMLLKLGYDADIASNGLEVLQALSRKFYDVVLMDIQMPEMDGLEAARAIRKRLPLSNQPKIIAITAHAMEDDKKLCLDAGMDDYISKPLTLEKLKAALIKQK